MEMSIIENSSFPIQCLSQAPSDVDLKNALRMHSRFIALRTKGSRGQ
jgi:hypothetical protein